MQILTEITLGNVLSVLTILGGIIIAFQKLKDSLNEHERRLDQLEEYVEATKAHHTEIKATLSEMAADIRWITTTIRNNGCGPAGRSSQ